MEGVALTSFCRISNTALNGPGNEIIFRGFVVSTVLYLIGATERLSGWQLVALVFLLSTGFVAIVNILAFTLFPGLLKMVIPFSQHHYDMIEKHMILTLSCYMGLILIILLTKAVWKRLSRH